MILFDFFDIVVYLQVIVELILKKLWVHWYDVDT